MREIECIRWFIGSCGGFVCASLIVRWGGEMTLSWGVVFGESAAALGDKRVCVEVV
jgi:hypothetical protein